ncbi:MAG: AraC family transcriptional regulator [Spirochaetaceae bacterium]|nr:MAG: AraC family transcriptional regulator [Spirochaetaceae bacterium]
MDKIAPLVPLVPPTVVNAGTSRHGSQREQRYFVGRLWSINMSEYHAEAKYGSRSVQLMPGTIVVIPPDTPRTFYGTGIRVHRYIHFRCDDHPPLPDVVVFQSLSRFNAYVELFEEIVSCFRGNPARASAATWLMLHRIAEDVATSESGRVHDLAAGSRSREIFRKAVTYAEGSLGCSVQELARACDVSHNHLIRIFREVTARTPIVFLRNLRMEKAAHLLEHSNRSAKEIAALCGVGNAQRLNKVFRIVHGVSPTEYRRRSGNNT